MREIVLDTETTGLDPDSGHRVVEIGCVELLNHVPTGRSRQFYLNPERDMPEEAFAVHGLSLDFLSDKPLFHAIASELVSFLGEDRLIIHNASFDLKFLNAEFSRCGHPAIPFERAVDTLFLARSKFPGERCSLDVLCKRFNVDLSRRSKHGALLDAELLAEVYLELIGGRQAALGLTLAAEDTITVAPRERPVRPPRPHGPSAAEMAAHERFIADAVPDAIWLRTG